MGLKPSVVIQKVDKPMIRFAALAWWPETNQVSVRHRLDKCYQITPTIAIEVLFNLSLLVI